MKTDDETSPPQELELLLPPNEEAAAPLPVCNEVSTEPYIYTTDADTDEFKRSFAMTFNIRKKPKSLFVMTLGLPEFQGILDRPPLSVVKRKEVNEAYVPKADDFKHEVKRRAHFFMNVPDESSYVTDELQRNHPLKTRRNKIVLPQPNQWLNTRLKKWLQDRPMKYNEKDINFLQSEVNKALAFLSNESLVEAGDAGAVVPDTPNHNTGAILDVVTPVPTTPIPTPTVSLPLLPTDPYLYTSVADTDEFKRSAAMTYIKMDSKARVVIAMALGMIEYQGLLDRPPFSIAKRRELTDDFMPRAEDYRFEIKRRAHFFMHSEDEALFFTRDLMKKHPLENMRGVVSTPQPNQWKIQALRGWLSERPLKPNKQDSAFIRDSIQKVLNSLMVVLDREKVKTEDPALKKARKMPWGTAGATGPGAASVSDKEETLMECIVKQEALLGAVAKQTNQQSLLNKVTVLNQAITGYQQEISSLRSTLNDLENRILTVEMKIAETPAAEERLNAILNKQKDAKAATETEIAKFQQLIDENRKKIDEYNENIDELYNADDGALSRKRKHEETVDSTKVESEEL